MSYQKPSTSPGLRLHFNENTGGCSPAVLEALRSIGREDVGFYPDYAEITAATERYFGVAPGWVQLTNGLDEGLHVVAQLAANRARPSIEANSGGLSDPAHANTNQGPGPAFANRGQAPSTSRTEPVLIVDPAFEMYAASAEAVGLGALHIQPEDDFCFPLEAILAAIGPHTRLVYLTDPNNPTGLAIPPGAVEQIAAAAPHAIVLVDEAYAEFSGRTFIGPPLDRHRNLVVGRTFAKAHGLAALRVGALVAHPDTLAPIRRILPPYSLNIAAVRALAAALQTPDYLEQYVAQSQESRRLIYAACDRHGFKYWPSEANFVLFRVGPDAAGIATELAARGVLIRDRSASPGCGGCLRVTAGIVTHTRILLSALEVVLASRPR
jgi:histidinol-phosphate aminotransferase